MFGTAGKISDHVARDRGFAVLDITLGDNFSPYYDMAEFRQALARVESGAIADTENLTIGFTQATTAGGAGDKIVGVDTARVAVGGDGAAGFSLEREIEVSDLDTENGFRFIRIKVTSDDAGAVVGGASLIRDGGRY